MSTAPAERTAVAPNPQFRRRHRVLEFSTEAALGDLWRELWSVRCRTNGDAMRGGSGVRDQVVDWEGIEALRGGLREEGLSLEPRQERD